MIKITIPGFKNLEIDHLLLDYNGTLAQDGKLIGGVEQRLNHLAEKVQIHVITADTFGQVEQELKEITCRLQIIPKGNQALSKLDYLNQLGVESTVCIGNGYNDYLMLKEAPLGIALCQGEGGATKAMLAADLVIGDILAALDLFVNPLRLIATLRS